MNITKRLYTYPVLSDEKDDYKTSIFDVDFKCEKNGINSLLFKFNITMNNDEINDFINNGTAVYAIHIECSKTSFRKIYYSESVKKEIEILESSINDKIEVVVFIINKKEIVKFKSNDWVEDFEGIQFNLKKASILAYKNLPMVNITKNYKEFNNLNSIFSIYRRATEESKAIEINLNSNKIRIGLSSKDYKVYSNYKNRTKYQPILNSIIVLPSLVFVFEELKQENAIEYYEDKEWFRSLEISYKKRGIDFFDEITNGQKTSIQLAQEAMELPISTALSNLKNLDEEE